MVKHQKLLEFWRKAWLLFIDEGANKQIIIVKIEKARKISPKSPFWSSPLSTSKLRLQ